jgi:hypothetical protein
MPAGTCVQARSSHAHRATLINDMFDNLLIAPSEVLPGLWLAEHSSNCCAMQVLVLPSQIPAPLRQQQQDQHHEEKILLCTRGSRGSQRWRWHDVVHHRSIVVIRAGVWLGSGVM